MVTATKTETLTIDAIPDASLGVDGDVLIVESGGYVLSPIAAFDVPDPSFGVDGDVISVSSGSYVLSAGSGSLPSQTGNSGKFLNTDGTSPSWQTAPGGTVSSGSITPLVKGATTAGTTTYTVQQGGWEKRSDSDIVNFWLRVDWSAASGTGQLLIDGLPYSAAGFIPVTVYQNNVSPGSGNEIAGNIISSSTTVGMYVMSQTGGASFKNVTSTGSLTISGFYFKA